jgi:glycosyltransferase involved in cell wall biosynthesis
MNRLAHLQKTLPQNLLDCSDYPNTEFVILDYNSSDGLENWINQNLYSWKNKVAYYKTTEPQSYARSHSRNMVFSLANGDILCNLDADNYVGNGFAQFINDTFNKKNNIFLTALESISCDTVGKVCVRKTDFDTIGGYDEQFSAYGFEDNDFKNRLKNHGLKGVYFSQKKFIKVITHKDDERIKNEKIYQNLQTLFVEKISAYQTKIIFIFKDQTFESAEIIDNFLMPDVLKNSFVKIVDTSMRFHIINNSQKTGVFSAKNILKNWEKISDDEAILAVIFFYSQLKNKIVTNNNFHQKRIKVNENGYGKGIVYKNLDFLNPIYI